MNIQPLKIAKCVMIEDSCLIHGNPCLQQFTREDIRWTPTHPNLTNLSKRIETFAMAPFLFYSNAINISKAGLYFTGNSVRCFHCGKDNRIENVLTRLTDQRNHNVGCVYFRMVAE